MTSKPGYKVFRGDPERRFFQKVAPANDEGCLLWTGALDSQGYGQFRSPAGKNVKAHRWIYERKVGPIPPGLVGDHECHNRDLTCPGGKCRHRRCVNWDHQKPKTFTENVRAGRAGAAQAARTHCPANHPYDVYGAARTHCPANHPYDVYGVVYPSSNGKRECRECKRLRSAAFDAKRRLAKGMVD